MTSVAAHSTVSPSGSSEGALLLVCLPIDLRALARWSAGTGQAALQDDVGYALHALMRAALGELAPKPFVLIHRSGAAQVLGYARCSEGELLRAFQLAPGSEPAAAAALCLSGDRAAVVRAMPGDWHSGERFSFEARVAPVVRSRQPDGSYPEIDAAYHTAFCGERPGDRDSAHAVWLAKELGRGGASTLLKHEVVRFELGEIARRYQVGTAKQPERRTRGGLLPDLTVRGQLRVDDPVAFRALLARGLGRHRSFGFGCLLLAPAGAWT